MKAKLAVGDRVYIRDRRSRTDAYHPGTVVEVARVYCWVRLDHGHIMGQRFDTVTGAGEWPGHKRGMCPYFLLRPEEHASIMAEKAEREAAAKTAEERAASRLREIGIDLLPGRAAQIHATTLLDIVERHGVTDPTSVSP